MHGDAEEESKRRWYLTSARKDKTKRRLRTSRFGARVRGTEQPPQGLSRQVKYYLSLAGGDLASGTA